MSNETGGATYPEKNATTMKATATLCTPMIGTYCAKLDKTRRKKKMKPVLRVARQGWTLN